MKVGIGHDSHRFIEGESCRKLILGGVVFENCPPLEGNSDADVVLHSITNAISGVTCVNILGEISDKLCRENGITESSAYVLEALKHLKSTIVHLSISIECKRPLITPAIPLMRKKISELLAISPDSIGITATSGEGLTDFGKGLGIQVFSCVTVE
ncbi:MAG: 2-C-methyl-D-erythritol 2,4-cyclodiphosphate synthase [Eubacteriales bacterium]|nr:2-C-methyl-D-erythritol 2,4-cyclodiphosphate synthase [Eubacteriales bacterium]